MPTIQDVPLKDLYAEYLNQRSIRLAAQLASDAISTELNRRLANNLATNLLTAKGKTHGEATDTIDGIKVMVKIGQKVEWDDEKLKKAYATQPGEVAEKIFKVSISVPEKIFNAITDPKLNEMLIEARTVTLTGPVVGFAELPK